MSYTFDPTPPVDDISALRIALDDMVESGALFSDEILDYFLTTAGAVTGALALAYRSLANKYTKLASFSIGGLRVDYGARAILWARRASEVEAEVIVPVGPVLTAGGLYAALQGPYFTHDMMDSIYTGHDLYEIPE